MIRGLFAFFAAVCLTMTAAAAQSVSDDARQAERLAGQGKYLAAMAALDSAADVLWQKAPLVCRRILWVADRASGFGEYNPRETAVFKSGDAMLAYAEPIGFGWRKSGEIWHTNLVADFIIRSKSGKELLRRDDFGKFDIASRARNREFMLNLRYRCRARRRATTWPSRTCATRSPARKANAPCLSRSAKRVLMSAGTEMSAGKTAAADSTAGMPCALPRG